MYKNLILILFVFYLTMLPAKEISVLVEGKGTTTQEAKKDGWKQAIEKVVGIHLKAESKTEKFQLVMDRISVKSQGFVSRYKVYDVNKIDNMVIATMKVWVKKGLKDEIMRIIHELGNMSVGVYIGLQKQDTYASQSMQAQIYATNAARKKVGSIIKEFLLNKGFLVVYKQALDRHIKEMRNVGQMSGLDENSLNLDKDVDYRLKITINAGKIPAARQGYSCYIFDVTLTGYITSLGVQMNQLNLGGNKFSVLVRNSLTTSQQALKAYFTREAQNIAKILAPRILIQLKRGVDKTKTHHLYELRFVKYSTGAHFKIYSFLNTIPNLKIEKWDISSGGLDSLAIAKIKYNTSQNDPGAILMRLIYSKLKNCKNPDSIYSENLTPGHGMYKRGHVLVFKY